jgi:hypothetical protein
MTSSASRGLPAAYQEYAAVAPHFGRLVLLAPRAALLLEGVRWHQVYLTSTWPFIVGCRPQM